MNVLTDLLHLLCFLFCHQCPIKNEKDAITFSWLSSIMERMQMLTENSCYRQFSPYWTAIFSKRSYIHYIFQIWHVSFYVGIANAFTYTNYCFSHDTWYFMFVANFGWYILCLLVKKNLLRFGKILILRQLPIPHNKFHKQHLP